MIEPKIIFEDEDLLVLDKPSGMIVNKADTTKGEKTVQEWVEEYLRVPRVERVPRVPQGEDSTRDTFVSPRDTFLQRAGIVHRLDKETSGILLVAKNLEAFVNLQAQFKERKVQKTYLALAHGKIDPPEGEINVNVGRLPWNRKRFGVLAEGKEAVTKYKVLCNVILRPHAEGSHEILPLRQTQGQNDMRNEQLTLVELSPKTGRTHQIRVHLQYIHHPIFSDPLYAGRKTSRNDRKILSRIFLHASKISFMHPSFAKASAGKPKTNKVLNFEIPLPEDLNKFLVFLKQDS